MTLISLRGLVTLVLLIMTTTDFPGNTSHAYHTLACPPYAPSINVLRTFKAIQIPSNPLHKSPLSPLVKCRCHPTNLVLGTHRSIRNPVAVQSATVPSQLGLWLHRIRRRVFISRPSEQWRLKLCENIASRRVNDLDKMVTFSTRSAQAYMKPCL